ncbi:MAG TPA: alpha/beta fold hydrolase [Streptosporangiaceae bacterium]|nr:alpha/beta fold hydrolase [Streptosporangiaceae bacterium]
MVEARAAVAGAAAGARFPVRVPDGLLAGEEAGDGDPVVLIHGFSFDRSMWDPQFPDLARRYRTIRYDLRGFGESGLPVANRDHVTDLLALLDALGIDRAHLAGLSLGANIALAAAALHPNRVRTITLASPGLPGYPWRTPRPPEEAAALAGREGIEAAKHWWLNHEIFCATRRYPAAREQLAAMVARFPAHQWDSALPAAPQLPPLTGFLPRLVAPALILGGALDVAGYREIAGVLAQEIPGAERQEFAGCGHLLNLERPAEFTGRLLRFLACHA